MCCVQCHTWALDVQVSECRGCLAVPHGLVLFRGVLDCSYWQADNPTPLGIGAGNLHILTNGYKCVNEPKLLCNNSDLSDVSNFLDAEKLNSIPSVINVWLILFILSNFDLLISLTLVSTIVFLLYFEYETLN